MKQQKINKFRAGDVVKHITKGEESMTVVGYTNNMVFCTLFSFTEYKFKKYLLPENELEIFKKSGE